MNTNNIWKTIYDSLQQGERLILIVVLSKEGSAPVSPGFKMIVSSSGSLTGTVGGGVVEHQLVEKAKAMLSEESSSSVFQKFQHNERAKKNRSGMICSGSHSVVLVLIDNENKKEIEEIADYEDQNIARAILITPQGVGVEETTMKDKDPSFKEFGEGQWEYRENTGLRNILYIVGGGHVGLALSRIAATLGFYIKVIDNRHNLDTMRSNSFADELVVTNYEDITKHIKAGPHSYVVIMTFKHQEDHRVLRQLIQNHYQYLGMMAAKAKKAKIYQALTKEGIAEDMLNAVHSPIGIPINSETAEEIAISITAELIKVKNTKLK